MRGSRSDRANTVPLGAVCGRWRCGTAAADAHTRYRHGVGDPRDGGAVAEPPRAGNRYRTLGGACGGGGRLRAGSRNPRPLRRRTGAPAWRNWKAPPSGGPAKRTRRDNAKAKTAGRKPRGRRDESGDGAAGALAGRTGPLAGAASARRRRRMWSSWRWPSRAGSYAARWRWIRMPYAAWCWRPWRRCRRERSTVHGCTPRRRRW